MKNKLLVLFITLLPIMGISQERNFGSIPYLETYANVDTLVTPDRIYLSILITEADTKGKVSVEELENKMIEKLLALNIDLEKQLFLNDLASNFRRYFLKPQDVLKSKSYTLIMYDANAAGVVVIELEKIGISNIDVEKTEYTRIEDLKLALRTKAILKAISQGEALLKGLNQTLGKVIFVSDINTAMYLDLEGRAVGIRIRHAEQASQYVGEPLYIEFEKIKVEIGVKVFFTLN